jgi:hypothetical protein
MRTPALSDMSGIGDYAANCDSFKKNVRLRDCVLVHSARVKKKELTPKQLSSVSCPTCGVATGKRCVLLSGAPRSNPHVDRRLAAAEAIGRK